MTVPFLKMHGLGNDFVVLDARAERLDLPPALLRAIADRRRGVGCDQIVVLEPPEEGGDARVRFWNSDGSEAGACGNGSRCVAALLMSESGQATARLETQGGLLGCRMQGDGLITVDMGRPRFDWQDIPLAERMDTRVLDVRLGPIDNPVLIGPTAVNVGNPHCIFFVQTIETHDLARFGPLIENHPLFPERVNVSLAQVTSRSSLRLKVWERGAGITQACGTAACASAVAAARLGHTGREVDVTLDGGVLAIQWRESDDHILMTGPVAVAFSGGLDLEMQAPAEARS